MPFAGAIAPCTIMLLLLLVPCGEGQPPEARPGGLPIEQILSENGCGAFAGLVAATAGVGQVFLKKSADDAGLTIFCPDDDAVAAFVPRFNNLTADGQAALLLYHGLPVRRSEKALRFIDWEVPTLDRGAMLTIFDYGGTVILSSPSRSSASVTKMVVDDAGLAVYLIGAVLVPIKPTAALDPSDIVLLCIFLGPLVL